MKLNKEIIFIVMSLSFIGIATINAQDFTNSGIYLSYHDYNQGKISFAFNCNSSGRIKLNDFLSSEFVDVIIDGRKTQLNKDSIFGYRNCKNETYRFYKKHDEEFRILENKGIVIYTSNVRISSNNGKNNKLIAEYFFSKTESSEILSLTMQNLKHVFSDNIKFQNMLDMEFGSGETISIFSTSHNMFEVNYLLTKSNQ